MNINKFKDLINKNIKIPDKIAIFFNKLGFVSVSVCAKITGCDDLTALSNTSRESRQNKGTSESSICKVGFNIRNCSTSTMFTIINDYLHRTCSIIGIVNFVAGNRSCAREIHVRFPKFLSVLITAKYLKYK